MYNVYMYIVFIHVYMCMNTMYMHSTLHIGACIATIYRARAIPIHTYFVCFSRLYIVVYMYIVICTLYMYVHEHYVCA